MQIKTAMIRAGSIGLVQIRDAADPPTITTHESRGQEMLRGIAPTAPPSSFRTKEPVDTASMGMGV